MLSDWVILTLLAGVAGNIFSFVSRVSLKDNGDATTWAWTFEAIRLVVFIFIVIFDFKLQFNLQNLFVLLIVGLTEIISVFWYMKMHQYTQLSISTLIYRTRLVWIPIIMFIFYGEKLSYVEYLGMLITFLGLSIVVSPHKLFADKGMLYANGAAFATATNTIAQKMATPFASPSIIMIAMSLPSVILFPLIMKNTRKRLFAENRHRLGIKFLAVLANVFSSILFLKALTLGDVSKVNAIYQSMLILGVLGGIIFLKEKQDIFKKLLGSVITIIGVILLT